MFHFKGQMMYNVYLISVSYIYLPYLILLYILALYESTPGYIPIHHKMHIKYSNKPLLLLLLWLFVNAIKLTFAVGRRVCACGFYFSTSLSAPVCVFCSPPLHAFHAFLALPACLAPYNLLFLIAGDYYMRCVVCFSLHDIGLVSFDLFSMTVNRIAIHQALMITVIASTQSPACFHSVTQLQRAMLI